MTKPVSRSSEEMARELLAQNFQYSQESRIQLEELKKAHDEIAKLRGELAEAKKARPAGRMQA